MMEAAIEGLTREDGTRPILIAVTQWTSTDQESMENDLLIREPIADVVMHYAANAKNDGLQATLSDFIDILRKKHPETPILMVSVTPLVDELEQCACTPYRMAQTQLFLNELQKRRENGDKNIHFLDGSGLYGADWTECTVDGVHATDLGFYMIAKHTAPVIAGILERV